MLNSRFSRFCPRIQLAKICIALALAFGGAAGAAAADYVKGDIKIGQPWSRATPGGARIGAGYLTLENTGVKADRLVGIESAISGRGEIHEMKMNKGVMTMRQLASGLDLPPGKKVALKPGSYHLMFMDLKQPIKKGVPFKATLVFQVAGRIEVEFHPAAIGAGAPAGHKMKTH
jgi:periplasmic copper chaperone A